MTRAIAPEKVFVAVNYDWGRVDTYRVAPRAGTVRERVADCHRCNNEDPKVGWDRARKKGWRIARATITLDPLTSDE